MAILSSIESLRTIFLNSGLRLGQVFDAEMFHVESCIPSVANDDRLSTQSSKSMIESILSHITPEGGDNL